MAAAPQQTDLYDVLGVDRKASKSEIKKAYHKLALANHPDKVTIENREAAEIQFKVISQAYDILYDEEKRDVYDDHGMSAFDGSRLGGMGDVDVNDILSELFGDIDMGGMGGMPGMGGARKMRPRKGADEEKPYDITLEELYTGKSQKFTATKNVLCSHCKGKGGKDHAKPKHCVSCGGHGFRQHMRKHGLSLEQATFTCDSCQGKGEIYNDKDKCRKCKGRKIVSEKKVLELYIPRGSHDGDSIVLQGEGDQAPDQVPGDIIFILQQKEHSIFKRSGDNLLAEVEITLVEALCGLSRVVLKHLDGRGLHINHQKPSGGVLRPGQVLRLRGEGMPFKRSDGKGDLYLKVQILFPEDDWLQNEKTTSKLKEILPNSPPKITAETIDEIEHDQHADLEDFGSTGDPDDWEDEDDGSGHKAQCPQQ